MTGISIFDTLDNSYKTITLQKDAYSTLITITNNDTGDVTVNLYKIATIDTAAINIVPKDIVLAVGECFVVENRINLLAGQSFKLTSNGGIAYDFNMVYDE